MVLDENKRNNILKGSYCYKVLQEINLNLKEIWFFSLFFCNVDIVDLYGLLRILKGGVKTTVRKSPTIVKRVYNNNKKKRNESGK